MCFLEGPSKGQENKFKMENLTPFETVVTPMAGTGGDMGGGTSSASASKDGATKVVIVGASQEEKERDAKRARLTDLFKAGLKGGDDNADKMLVPP